MNVIFHKCEKCNCFSHCNNNDLVCQTEYFKLQRENEYLKELMRHWATCQECYEDGYQDGLRNNKKLIEYKQALEEIEKVANCSDCLPCLKHYCDCENCNEESADKGERCMQYGLEKILDIISKARE